MLKYCAALALVAFATLFIIVESHQRYGSTDSAAAARGSNHGQHEHIGSSTSHANQHQHGSAPSSSGHAHHHGSASVQVDPQDCTALAATLPWPNKENLWNETFAGNVTVQKEFLECKSKYRKAVCYNGKARFVQDMGFSVDVLKPRCKGYRSKFSYCCSKLSRNQLIGGFKVYCPMYNVNCLQFEKEFQEEEEESNLNGTTTATASVQHRHRRYPSLVPKRETATKFKESCDEFMQQCQHFKSAMNAFTYCEFFKRSDVKCDKENKYCQIFESFCDEN